MEIDLMHSVATITEKHHMRILHAYMETKN